MDSPVADGNEALGLRTAFTDLDDKGETIPDGVCPAKPIAKMDREVGGAGLLRPVPEFVEIVLERQFDALLQGEGTGSALRCLCQTAVDSENCRQ